MKRVCDNVSELYFERAKNDPHLSLAQCGEEMCAGYGTLNGWVNRKNDPQCALIPRIAKYFGVPIDRLFEGVE